MVTADFLKTEMVAAMKSGDKAKVSVLRMVIAEVANGKVATKPVSELDSVLAYRKKLVKANDEFPTDALAYEIGVIDAYLPKAPTTDELNTAAEALKGQKLGVIMKSLKSQFPTVDGSALKTAAEKWQG